MAVPFGMWHVIHRWEGLCLLGEELHMPLRHEVLGLFIPDNVSYLSALNRESARRRTRSWVILTSNCTFWVYTRRALLRSTPLVCRSSRLLSSSV